MVAARRQLAPQFPGVVILVVVVVVVVVVDDVVLVDLGLLLPLPYPCVEESTSFQPLNSVVVLVLSENDWILGTNGGGPELTLLDSVVVFRVTPGIDGNFGLKFFSVVDDSASVLSPPSLLYPGGKSE